MGDAEALGNCDALGTGLISCQRCVGSVLKRTAALAEAEAYTAVTPPPTANHREQALLELRATFGAQVGDLVDSSHRLSFAAPLLYCRRCGAHGASPQYLVSLKGACLPTLARTKAMLRQLEMGRHPTTRSLLAAPVPVHDFTEEENEEQLRRARQVVPDGRGRKRRRR